jgi:urease alpha subunit
VSKRLPYRAMTTSGNQFDFEFDLHPDTASAVNVSNLLTAVLTTLDGEIKQIGGIGNGDILQALAMALAVRTRILAGSNATLHGLSVDLLSTALASSCDAGLGNIEADSPTDLH